MNDIVRPGRHDDVVVVAELEQCAREHLVDQRGGPALLDEVSAVGEWAAVVDDGLLWVAEIDGVVLGFLQLEVHGPVAAVRQVYVDPGARELGFGDEMLAAAMREASRRGCHTIEGVALPGDRDTKNLYERAGITARKIVVSKRL